MKRTLYIALVATLGVNLLASDISRPGDVPAYNATPPKKGQKLKPVMHGMQLTGPHFRHPAQVASYKAAAKHGDVLHQLPCYCYCDRGHGHNSLRSCFEDEHGANCSVCMAEALFAAEQIKKGKTVKQIRASIIKGEHRQIDLNTIR